MLFLRRKKSFSWRFCGTILVFFLCALLLWRSVSSISAQAKASQIENLKNAIERSAVHCYAVEGSYPESLDYIEEHYGISWDSDKYVVDYTVLGSNMMPSVTIIPLSGQEVPG